MSRNIYKKIGFSNGRPKLANFETWFYTATVYSKGNWNHRIVKKMWKGKR